ncbi:MAG: hypothetical protein Tsb0021_18040 [Chlamydiales bacterium]
MQQSKDPKVTQYIRLLTLANRLGVKVQKAKSREALIFIILNDTIHFARYDRARLIQVKKDEAKVLGVSGHTKIVQDKEVNALWHELYHTIDQQDEAHIISWKQLKSHKDMVKILGFSEETTVFWIPITVDEEGSLILVLERWTQVKGELPSQAVPGMMREHLVPIYATAWEKYGTHSFLENVKELFKGKTTWALLILLFFSVLIRIPLRVVAPCEVIPDEPKVISAPLKGIIDEVVVRPGQEVQEGEVLFEYDKRVPLRELNVAAKEVDILSSELERAVLLGPQDPEALKEIALLKLKLEREQIKLDIAKFQASQLTVISPIKGVAIVDDPFEWRGKPVEVGEKVLVVTDPTNTRVKIFIPERDNISFNFEKPLKVILNPKPEVTYYAQLIYVAKEAILNEAQQPVFIAEAEWIDNPEDVRIGIKGSCVLYGERVSLFYYLMRKPWSYLRYLTGF